MKKIHELMLKGGFGNQLFILYEAYRISIVNPDDKVYLNCAPIFLSGRADRSLQIENLIKSNNIFLTNSFFSIVKYIFIHALVKFFNKLTLVNIYSFDFYFYKISNSYYQTLAEDDLSEKILEIMRPIFFSDKVNTLAIHVRRGDYLNSNHQMHGIIDIVKIINEVYYFISKHKFDSLTIFTDSPEQIDLSEFLQFQIPVYLDNGGEPVEVFRRMCNSVGIIGANSTFSLWAIILGNPELSSIPLYWNRVQNSYHLGLKNLRRYS